MHSLAGITSRKAGPLHLSSGRCERKHQPSRLSQARQVNRPSTTALRWCAVNSDARPVAARHPRSRRACRPGWRERLPSLIGPPDASWGFLEARPLTDPLQSDILPVRSGPW